MAFNAGPRHGSQYAASVGSLPHMKRTICKLCFTDQGLAQNRKCRVIMIAVGVLWAQIVRDCYKLSNVFFNGGFIGFVKISSVLSNIGEYGFQDLVEFLHRLLRGFCVGDLGGKEEKG